MSDQAAMNYYSPTEAEKAESRRTTAIYTAQQLPQLYSSPEDFIAFAKKIEDYIKDGV